MLTTCVSCKDRWWYAPHLPPCLSLVSFHKILQSLPLLFAFTHSSPQLPSLLLTSFESPSLHHAAESEEDGDCEKDRKRGRVTKAEVTLIYSLLSTLQLGVKWQNTGNTFRDTIYSLTPTQVCFLCFFYVNLL